METITQETIDKSISAAYDSVKLIDELNLLASMDTEQTNTLARNKEHLTIMLAKDWFINGCTETQITELTKASI
jgi:hypothetical protein